MKNNKHIANQKQGMWPSFGQKVYKVAITVVKMFLQRK